MLILNSFRIMWCFFPDTILNTIPTLESCGGDCSHFVERFNRQSRLSNDWFLCVTIIIITIRTGRIEFWFKRLNYRQSRGLYAISTPPIAHKSMLGLTSQKSMFRRDVAIQVRAPPPMGSLSSWFSVLGRSFATPLPNRFSMVDGSCSFTYRAVSRRSTTVGFFAVFLCANVGSGLLCQQRPPVK